MIYAVQCGAGGPIKLGFTSKDPQVRLNQLQNGNHQKLTLLAAADGGEWTEKEIHRLLAKYRIRGEWYRPLVPVLEMVRVIREGKALQSVALEIAEDYFKCRSAQINISSAKRSRNRRNLPAERYAQAS